MHFTPLMMLSLFSDPPGRFALKEKKDALSDTLGRELVLSLRAQLVSLSDGGGVPTNAVPISTKSTEGFSRV